MDSRVSLQPAYILHRRPFQNSSLLVDFFTLDHGRVTAVAKGARRQKSRYRALMQLFHPLLVSFSGRGEVKTVTAVEAAREAITLRGERLFSALYLNELLARLLQNGEEQIGLYKHYQRSLLALQDRFELEVVLRNFELNLLMELGYGINLQEDCLSQQPIAAEAVYRFTADLGFERIEADGDITGNLFYGRHLTALRELRLDEPEAAAAAKRLLRMALSAHLGDKPLTSRSLFMARL